MKVVLSPKGHNDFTGKSIRSALDRQKEVLRKATEELDKVKGDPAYRVSNARQDYSAANHLYKKLVAIHNLYRHGETVELDDREIILIFGDTPIDK